MFLKKMDLNDTYMYTEERRIYGLYVHLLYTNWFVLYYLILVS